METDCPPWGTHVVTLSTNQLRALHRRYDGKSHSIVMFLTGTTIHVRI